MDRVPGHAWLLILGAIVLLTVTSAVPYASAGMAAALAAAQDSSLIGPFKIEVNPWRAAGAAALVETGLLLLLFLYRRRSYILFWTAGWLLLSLSMALAGRQSSGPQVLNLSFGVSQFLGIVSALFFVIGGDAYPTRPRLRRGGALVLIGLLFWFALAPLSLGPAAVFGPGHLLIAGALAAAGIGHLMVLRQSRMLGAAVIGISLLLAAGSHVWVLLGVRGPRADGTIGHLYFNAVVYLVTALGMKLMTFEDMTSELRRANRRLESAQGKLRRMVITDALTGCRNRRFFDEVIGRELQRHQRYGVPLSLLFVDVNSFKAVNDTLGHDAGDRVLREVARFLLTNIREADYVFRWGGDEFLILLSCAEQEAQQRGAALQADFEDFSTLTALPPGVGLSFGSAQITDDTSDVMALIKLADDRMYQNKRAGKISEVGSVS